MTLAFNDVPSALCDQCFEQSANVKCLTVVLLQQAHKLVIPVDDRIFRFQRFGLMDKENCARRPLLRPGRKRFAGRREVSQQETTEENVRGGDGKRLADDVLNAKFELRSAIAQSFFDKVLGVQWYDRA